MTPTRWSGVVGAGLAGLLAVAPAQARPGDSGAADAGGAAAEVSGTVERVDREAKEITLAGSDSRLSVPDQAAIVKDGRRAALSEVREGDEIRASYSGSGAERRLSRLEVVGPPAFTDQG